MKKRRLALLGFGHVAEHGHAPQWRLRDDFEVVAIADPSLQRRERARELFPGAALYTDPSALLTDEAVDVVDIAAPPAAHAPLCLSAAAAGCHILCEKPLVTSLAELAQLRAAVAKAEVALVTVHNWKQAEQYRYLAALLDAGTLGTPRRVRLEVERVGRSASVGADWRIDKNTAGGGILVDHGWHAFYLLLGMARQTPRRVRATAQRRRYTDLGVEDTARCEVAFDTLAAELSLTWAGEARRNRWQIDGELGSVFVEGDGGELRLAASSTPLSFASSLSAGSHHSDWFGAVIDEWVHEIDGPRGRGRNLKEAAQCLTLTALAYASSENDGAWLSLLDAATDAPRTATHGSAALRT